MKKAILFIALSILTISAKPAGPGPKDMPPSLPCHYGERCWLGTAD